MKAKNSMYRKISVFFLICILLDVSVSLSDTVPIQKVSAKKVCKKKPQKKLLQRGAHFITEVVTDALRLNWNLFSITSVKVITAFTPLYIITRMVDEKIQCNFHDIETHKNINQFPRACHKIGRFGVGVPMLALSSLALFAPDEELRTTAYVFALGIPFVHSGKDIIKALRFKSCLRPWHEDFNHERRSSGGFPSGHMANVTYTAALFGMRFGPKWGVPLGLLASFIFADFLNCNRHYVSQLVAGAGLGVMFACAANKLIETKLSEKYEVSVGADYSGAPTMRFCYRF